MWQKQQMGEAGASTNVVCCAVGAQVLEAAGGPQPVLEAAQEALDDV